jgi:hypothetical protein
MAARTDNTVSGLIAVATGIAVALFVNLPPERGDAPAWVGDACAAAFFFAGISIVANSRHWPALVTKLAGIGAAYMLVVPAVWVVFGGDPGRCSVGAALGILSLGTSAGGALCRSVFGFGGLLTLVVAVLFTWQAFRVPRPVPSRRPN